MHLGLWLMPRCSLHLLSEVQLLKLKTVRLWSLKINWKCTNLAILKMIMALWPICHLFFNQWIAWTFSLTCLLVNLNRQKRFLQNIKNKYKSKSAINRNRLWNINWQNWPKTNQWTWRARWSLKAQKPLTQLTEKLQPLKILRKLKIINLINRLCTVYPLLIPY